MTSTVYYPTRKLPSDRSEVTLSASPRVNPQGEPEVMVLVTHHGAGGSGVGGHLLLTPEDALSLAARLVAAVKSAQS